MAADEDDCSDNDGEEEEEVLSTALMFEDCRR